MNKKYIVISIVSFLTLLIVQFILVYNTFSLRNSQYALKERRILDSAYRVLVVNDKLFPGGQAIIDSLINPNYTILFKLHREQPKNYLSFTNRLCDTLLSRLSRANNLDHFFANLLLQKKIRTLLDYRIVIKDLQITPDGKNYISILNYKSDSATSNNIISVGGKLDELNKQNEISPIVVSSPAANSYRIRFALHADNLRTRQTEIFKAMLPTLLVVMLSIIFIVSLFYVTITNWMKQKKMAEITADFLNSIRHEFNTPLTTILVANRTLAQSAVTLATPAFNELTTIINRQSLRLQKLIKQALNIAELNDHSFEKETYDLYPLLTEIIQDYSYSLKENEAIKFDKTADHGHIKITANKFLLTTAIYNLFDNALRYNKSQEKMIIVYLTQKNERIGLAIRDNGIGLREEQQKYIFQKFYQVYKQQGKGLGLGLFYVERVVAAHQWQVEVKSKIDVGTTFYIWLDTINLS